MTPTIIFEPDVGTTLGTTGGSWSPDKTTYSENYLIQLTEPTEIDGVSISLENAKDTVGNSHFADIVR